jgi:hypothetical protein
VSARLVCLLLTLEEGEEMVVVVMVVARDGAALGEGMRCAAVWCEIGGRRNAIRLLTGRADCRADTWSFCSSQPPSSAIATIPYK